MQRLAVVMATLAVVRCAAALDNPWRPEIQRCYKKAACDDGFYCIDNLCLKPCGTSDRDCNIYDDFRCFNGFCRPSDMICLDNSDCPDKYQCVAMETYDDKMRGQCLKSCSDNYDCIRAEGYLCIDGTCKKQSDTCKLDTDCPDDYVCEAAYRSRWAIERKCLKECIDDLECNVIQGFRCAADGRCHFIKGICLKDNDCATGYTCLTGDCFKKCVDSSTCNIAEDFRCVQGRCEKSECTPDSDENCGEGESCGRVDDKPITYKCLRACSDAGECSVIESCVDDVCLPKTMFLKRFVTYDRNTEKHVVY